VPLQPPVTRDTELDATLYLDSDGNGAFDAAVDLPVPAPDRSHDQDRTGVGRRDRVIPPVRRPQPR
jgi:hypothetical protein